MSNPYQTPSHEDEKRGNVKRRFVLSIDRFVFIAVIGGVIVVALLYGYAYSVEKEAMQMLEEMDAVEAFLESQKAAQREAQE